ncbi:intermembrane transport protein PqiB [Vibrio panuliri]|uniref:Paraquat-inducible protein B n=1 Tax=Vibrio panuliri TaxID=1381081 RepID=A0A1Q9HD73_9VIBR|nr:intermembrane transport protein PqiB [Vibrio panuliri]KAB1457174.1 intermembrane transport protein PqiB [Vibrio panuliri]OLQ86846.1 paraquat-inducible protein B [Vibrio panuliri]OLQ87440.1 paraquat-inducible protein B [Vibrio panuliri]
MSDQNDVQANVSSRTNLSAVWLVPLVALGIGIWMLFEYVNSTGPEVTLIMSDASGIEVGKTQIKSLNVKVGVVTDVKLGANYENIVVKAQMDKDAERMLREDSQFWIVEPRVGKEGISGLETLLSGAYIQLQPGKSQQRKTRFEVLDVPPVAPPNAQGIRVILNHELAGQLNVGDPVIYQGFTAGRVEKVTIDAEKRIANYQLFIFEPFDALVRTASQFWLNSGVDLQLNAEGFKVRIDSIESLLGGGVSFGTLEKDNPGVVVEKDYQEYPLYDDKGDAEEGIYRQSLSFVVMFSDSLRGLKVGAPVEFRGLKIGTVTKVPWKRAQLDEGLDVSKIGVKIKIEPRRIFEHDNSLEKAQLLALFKQEFANGLRAKLHTGSLLTGALYVDLDYVEPEANFVTQEIDGYTVFPSMQSELAEVQTKMMEILNNLSELPLGESVSSLNRSLSELEKTLIAAEKTMNSIRTMVESDETQSLPQEVKQSLQELQRTLDSFNSNSSVYQNLDDSLIELEKTMKALQPVLKKIDQKPDVLIFGEDNNADPLPQKGSTK